MPKIRLFLYFITNKNKKKRAVSSRSIKTSFLYSPFLNLTKYEYRENDDSHSKIVKVNKLVNIGLYIVVHSQR